MEPHIMYKKYIFRLKLCYDIKEREKKFTMHYVFVENKKQTGYKL